MKLANCIVLALALVAASSCENEVQIAGGKVPSAYLPEAQVAMGTYVGSFNGLNNTLTATLSDNVVLLTASRDLIDARCGSSIGLLQSVGVTQDQNKNIVIQDAAFGFDPGLCIDVQGNTLNLSFGPNGQVSASILRTTQDRVQCTIGGGFYPVEQCWNQFVPVYSIGTFEKTH
jgi:hypothetical protein